MSLRQKAREVKEAGIAERSNFTPQGVPKRMYQWWLRESNSKRARAIKYGSRKENFCHFWRVVLFWAPARKVAYTIDKYLLNGYVGAFFLGLLALAALTFVILNPLTFVIGLGIATGVVLEGTGIFAGVSAAMTPSQRNQYDMLVDRRAIAAFFVLGLPLATLAFLVTRTGRFYSEHLTDYNKQFAIAISSLLVLAGGLSMALLGGISLLAVVLGAIALVAVGGVFVVILFNVMATYIDGKRAIAKAKREDRLAVYIAENGHEPQYVPNRFEKAFMAFFAGLGDFIVLIAQVIRVKKWKICPIVEIEDDRAAA